MNQIGKCIEPHLQKLLPFSQTGRLTSFPGMKEKIWRASGILEPMDKFPKMFPIAMPCTFSSVNNDRSQSVTFYKDTSVGEICPDLKRKAEQYPRYVITGFKPRLMTAISWNRSELERNYANEKAISYRSWSDNRRSEGEYVENHG